MAKDLVIERTFDAPVSKVWDAWTRPKLIKSWWGPLGFTAPRIKLDFRVGGKALFCMRGAGPDGVVRDYWSTGTYKEIEPMKKIVTTDSFSDSKGRIVPASYYGMEEEFPLELLITLTFKESHGKTRMRLVHKGHPDSSIEPARQGWSESFDKLEDTIMQDMTGLKIIAEPGKREMVITQTFDAPPKRVFAAYTDPKLIPRWWGPRIFSTTVEKMDVRSGGEWRFVQKDKDGKIYAFHGIYREIAPLKKIAQTFEFEGMPGHISEETATFEDLGGKTRVTAKSVFSTLEDRDGMIKEGMEWGVRESNARMAGLLAKEV